MGIELSGHCSLVSLRRQSKMRMIRFVAVMTMAVVWLAGYGNLPGWAQVDIKSGASPGQDTAVGQEFEAAMSKLDSAPQDFHNGRPGPVKALWSHADDVTLAAGAGGAIEKGSEHVGARLDFRTPSDWSGWGVFCLWLDSHGPQQASARWNFCRVTFTPM